MNMDSIFKTRRSCRNYTAQQIDAEVVEDILKAALLAPSSMNRHTTRLVVVDDPLTLEKLSDAKERGSAFVKDAAMAVVLIDHPADNDCWVEDASIAAFAMQCQAHDLGVGSCWVQIRGRYLPDGTKSEQVVRGILDLPDDDEVLCILSFGIPSKELPPHNEDELKWENISIK